MEIVLETDVLIYVLEFLDVSDIMTCTIVNHHFRVCSESQSVWKALYCSLHKTTITSRKVCNWRRKVNRGYKLIKYPNFLSIRTIQDDDQPIGNAGHSACYFPNHSPTEDLILTFGGMIAEDDTTYTNELNYLLMEADGQITWAGLPFEYATDLQAPNQELLWAKSRWQHSALAIDGKMWLFGGGRAEAHKSTDIKTYDPDACAWANLKLVEQDSPCARMASITLLTEDDNILVFAGRDCRGEVFNDTWLLNTKTLQWKKIDTSGHVPSPRYAASGQIYKNKLYVFGGWHNLAPDKQGKMNWLETTFFNDLHVLDLENWHWTHITTNTSPPSPRCQSVSFLIDEYFVIYGGAYHKVEKGQSTSVFILDDVWFLDLDTLVWIKGFNSKQLCLGTCTPIGKGKYYFIGGVKGWDATAALNSGVVVWDFSYWLSPTWKDPDTYKAQIEK